MSGFYNARQGYPFEQGILSPSRVSGAGTVFVVLDQVGEMRLPNFHNVDFHVERAGQRVDAAVRAVAGHVQCGELEHGAGDPQHAERGQRQPDSGDRRAARHPVRRPRELVAYDLAEFLRAGFLRGAGLFCGRINFQLPTPGLRAGASSVRYGEAPPEPSRPNAVFAKPRRSAGRISPREGGKLAGEVGS